MVRFSRMVGLASIGLALAGGTAASAAPSCWQEREVAAARVRQMQTMLMVATLRCRAAKFDISDDYNGFMTAQNAAVSAANLVIKQHFAQDGLTQADYDRFATALANGYGDDETSQASCAEASALAHEATAAREAGALDKVAQARLFPAMMPGGACGAPTTPMLAAATPPRAVAAAARPPVIALAASPAAVALPLLRLAPPASVAAKPPVLALAAPAPLPATPAAVSLPADVVAALTVMARFRDGQQATQPASTAVRVAAVGQ